MNKKIMNVMNFVRGCEPRQPEADLLTPVVEEIKLVKQYDLPSTFLLQYDAMMQSRFVDLFKAEKTDKMELGIWIELVKPLVEAVGIEWRGRPGYDWDWYVDPGFLCAYTQEEREKLCDEMMRYFKETFGEYPSVVGSWLLDSYSMDYMSKKYPVKAFCICREQVAVDAYTLWGGYYNGPFYASKYNPICPAQNAEDAIGAPVIRLLGIDPIYGYDECRNPHKYGFVMTMEAVSGRASHEECAEWDIKTFYENESLNLAYGQMGQENSFGWGSIGNGLPLQLKKVSEAAAAGKLEVMTVGDTGAWFKDNFALTPTAAITATTDWSDYGLRSIWFSSRYYRANLFIKDGKLFFRDIHKFDGRVKERYYIAPCHKWDAIYDTLPVTEGRLWCPDNDHDTGIYTVGDIAGFTTERDGDNLIVHAGVVTVTFTETGITVEGTPLHAIVGNPAASDTRLQVGRYSLCFVHEHTGYAIPITGTVTATDVGYDIEPDAEQGKIVLHMDYLY